MPETIEGPSRNSRDVSKSLLEVIKSAEGLMTIQEIAASASVNRLTAAKYLAILEARGMVSCRAIGRAKLYSLPKDAAKEKK